MIGRTIVFSLGALVISACSRDRAQPGNDRASAELAPARAYERGDGVPRDYARAAEVYAELCKDGAGNLDACDALFDAIVRGRGVAVDVARLAQLAVATCRQRDDATMCFRAAVISELSGRDDAAELAQRTEQVCQKGDLRACRELLVSRPGESAAQPREEEINAVACRGGDLGACVDRIGGLGCDAAEIVDEQACLESRRRGGDKDVLDAIDHLAKACDAGDALACDGLPRRALPPEQLCAAHDYGACAALACLGDDEAERIATEHGARAFCPEASARAMKAWMRLRNADPTNAPLPPVPADRMDPIPRRSVPPLHAVMFRAHGGGDANGWPRLDVNNVSESDVVELGICAYAYAEDGTQLARFRAVLTPPAPIHASTVEVIRLADLGAPPLPRTAVITAVDYDLARFATTKEPAEDPTRCPPELPLRSAVAVIGPAQR